MTELVPAAILTAVLVVGSRFAPASLRRSLPAAVLGGMVALALRQLGALPGSVIAWQDVGYHLFGASFLAIGLTPAKSPGISLRDGAAWMGVGQWVSFPLQAIMGGLVTWVAIGAGSDLHPAFGFLAPMGLNEGPGQAVSIGRLWEAEGLANAPSIGATMASLGFLVAYAGGVIVARRVRRSDRTRPAAAVPAPGRSNPVGPTGAAVESDAATSSKNRRSIVVTALAVAVGYAAIYLLVRWVTGLIGPDVQDLVLAVLFFVCLLIGMAVRAVLGRARVDVDDAALRTVTVWAVDGLTIAILGSLAWENVSDVAVPMAVVVALAVAATATAIWVMGRHLPTLKLERQLALFGTVTGTAASGLALIAMVDPEMETSASTELGAAVVVSTPVVLGGIAITTLAATGTLSLISTIAVLTALVTFSGAVQWWIVRRLTRAA